MKALILSLLLSCFIFEDRKCHIDTRQQDPNFIVIVLDDIGKRDVNTLQNSNVLNKLAQIGLSYNRAYGAPTCSPARSSLMFSQYFTRERGSPCMPPTADTPIPDQVLSLAEVFKQKNYNTGAFGKWHLGTDINGGPWWLTPTVHGFDVIGAGMPTNVKYDCPDLGGEDYDEWIRFENTGYWLETQYNTKAIRNSFAQWWLKTPGPKFAYLAFQAAHGPVHEPPADLVPNPIPWPTINVTLARHQFEHMELSLDTVLMQIANHIDENTYVIIVGDNGTAPQVVAHNQNPNKVKGTTFEGGVKIPFMIFGPGIQPGSSNELASLVDVMPTIADIIDVDISSYATDGHSLLDDTYNRDHIFTGLDQDRAVIQDRYKLRLINGVEQFYDLQNDANENTILDPDTLDPVIVESLRDQMQIYINRGL